MVGLSDDCQPFYCSMKEEEEFQAFARSGKALKEIYQRIAPSIFGQDSIKQAVACLLFSGSRKVGRAPY